MSLMDIETGGIAAIGPLASPPQTKYERLIAEAKKVPAGRTLVAHPCDESSLRGATEAAEAGIIIPVLVGPAERIAGGGAPSTASILPATRSSTHRTARRRRQQRSR